MKVWKQTWKYCQYWCDESESSPSLTSDSIVSNQQFYEL